MEKFILVMSMFFSVSNTAHGAINMPSLPSFAIPDSVQTIYAVSTLSPVSEPTFPFFYLLVLSLGLVWFTVENRRRTVRLLKAGYSYQNTVVAERMDAQVMGLFSTLSYVFFFAVSAFFLHYMFGESFAARPLLALVPTAFVVIVWLLLSDALQQMLFPGRQYLRLTKINRLVTVLWGTAILVFASWLVVFGHPYVKRILPFILSTVLSVVFVLYIVKMFRLARRYGVLFGSLRFILYICTLKLLPLILLVKWIGRDLYQLF